MTPVNLAVAEYKRLLFRRYEVRRALALGWWHALSIDTKVTLSIASMSVVLVVVCGMKAL